jgi:hypothetical protein
VLTAVSANPLGTRSLPAKRWRDDPAFRHHPAARASQQPAPATRRQRAFRPVRWPLRRRDADAARARARPGVSRGQGRPCVPGAVRRSARTLCRPPESPVLCRTPDRDAARVRTRGERRADLVQARRTQPHRRAQDQQLHRADPACDADGQDADHRRDRCRSARCRHRDGLRALRFAVRDLHGCKGHCAAGAQRVPHEAARRGSASGDERVAFAQGCDERGDARLGRERPRHFLHHRQGPIPIRNSFATSRA